MSKIVVVGGGIAGIEFIREFEKFDLKEKIVLIEPKDYLEVPYGMLRALVDPIDFGKKVRRRIKDLIHSKHIMSKVVELKKDKVILDNGDSINFDYCILATGSGINGFTELKIREKQSKKDRDIQWKGNSKLLKAANNIAIIGGGVVGVELAGEIKDVYKDKKVTLYNRGDRVLSSLSTSTSKRALNHLNKLGVETKLNSKPVVEKREKNKVILKLNDENIVYDVVYETFGNRFESDFAKKDFINSVNQKNQLIVDDYLKVKDATNIWAIGDINNVDEIKLGFLATKQAKFVAKNLYKEIKKKKVKKYKPMKKAFALITVGRKYGIGQAPFGRCDTLVKYKQKKNLFVDNTLNW